MHDLPEGPALLALARDVLLNDLMPLLPPERRLEALLVANCMAIAEREATQDQTTERVVVEELVVLSEPLTPTLSPPGGEREGPAGPQSTEPRSGGRDVGPAQREGEGLGCDGAADRLRRFARELRNGAFENSPEREARARAILWRLTIARLRLANPKYLSANGFA